MQNFDPAEVYARLAAHDNEIAALKKRLNGSDEHVTEAGVGATQATETVIPAAALGHYEGAPHTGSDRVPVRPDSNEPSVLDKFLAAKKG